MASLPPLVSFKQDVVDREAQKKTNTYGSNRNEDIQSKKDAVQKIHLNEEDELSILHEDYKVTDWDKKKLKIEKRSAAWLDRFLSKLDEKTDEIVDDSNKTYEERREERLKASGWTNTIVRLPSEPPKLSMQSIEQLETHEKPVPSGNFCYTCWGSVPLGPQRVCCVHCALVAHKDCIIELEKYLLPTKEKDSRGGRSQHTKRGDTARSFASKTNSARSKKKSFASTASPSSRRSGTAKDLTASLSSFASFLQEVGDDNSSEGGGSVGAPPTLDFAATLTDVAASIDSEEGNTGNGNGNAAVKNASACGTPSRSPTRLPSVTPTTPATPSPSTPATPSRPAALGGEKCVSSNKPIRWTCPFCLEDVQSKNNFLKKRFMDQYRSAMEIFAVVRLQSFCRMAPKRIQFVVVKIGIIRLQRLLRSLKFWKQMNEERKNRPWPFRIRMHSIQLFVPNPEAGAAYKRAAHKLPDPASHQVGDIMATVYQQYFGVGKQDGSKERGETAIVNFLRQGHVNAPTYALSFRSIQPMPKGSLFLTISVHNDDVTIDKETSMVVDNSRQLFRVDLPLTYSRLEKITASHLEEYGYPNIDPTVMQAINQHLRFAIFNLPECNNYILIPACPTSVQIKLTISQVSTWPKAVVIGQTVRDVKHFLFWKQCAAWHQGLTECNSRFDVPSADDGCKLILVGAAPQSTIVRTGSSTATDRTTMTAADADAAATTGGSLKTKKYTIADSPREFFGGVLSWSLLAIGNDEECDAGFIISLLQASTASGRRRMWCVLIDAQLMVFVSMGNLKPRWTINLRQCLVKPLPNAMFTISYDIHTWNFMGRNQSEGSKWFRKIYMHSQSQQIKRYHSLDFRSEPLRSFAPEAEVDDPALHMANSIPGSPVAGRSLGGVLMAAAGHRASVPAIFGNRRGSTSTVSSVNTYSSAGNNSYNVPPSPTQGAGGAAGVSQSRRASTVEAMARVEAVANQMKLENPVKKGARNAAELLDDRPAMSISTLLEILASDHELSAAHGHGDKRGSARARRERAQAKRRKYNNMFHKIREKQAGNIQGFLFLALGTSFRPRDVDTKNGADDDGYEYEDDGSVADSGKFSNNNNLVAFSFDSNSTL